MVCASDNDRVRLENAIGRLEQLASRLNGGSEESQYNAQTLNSEWHQEWQGRENELIEKLMRLDMTQPTTSTQDGWRVIHCDE
ncbi:hypothetical protein [Thalassoroseus pseudoceratinae]|uniref:hypothetical protein n=1 Tax=Thalassoroseus pseudoceratinae TaxID=2713176 RepID=UPI00141D9123|nr:hypothetical protein [Thalassoroseus pseudoceratinae]